ncbi:hypothetical protein PFISCL1PPCAC_4205, partial [Pristionchus fissidentatus]
LQSLSIRGDSNQRVHDATATRAISRIKNPRDSDGFEGCWNRGRIVVARADATTRATARRRRWSATTPTADDVLRTDDVNLPPIGTRARRKLSVRFFLFRVT